MIGLGLAPDGPARQVWYGITDQNTQVRSDYLCASLMRIYAELENGSNATIVLDLNALTFVEYFRVLH